MMIIKTMEERLSAMAQLGQQVLNNASAPSIECSILFFDNERAQETTRFATKLSMMGVIYNINLLMQQAAIDPLVADKVRELLQGDIMIKQRAIEMAAEADAAEKAAQDAAATGAAEEAAHAQPQDPEEASATPAE